MEEEVSECELVDSKSESVRCSIERNPEIVQSRNGSVANGTQTWGNGATVGVCASQFVPHVRKNLSYDGCRFSEGRETEVRKSTKVVEECLLIYFFLFFDLRVFFFLDIFFLVRRPAAYPFIFRTTSGISTGNPTPLDKF